MIDGATVREVLDAAVARHGAAFAEVLPTCRIWLNGDDADLDDDPVTVDDEVAVLPPVSGGG